jgi:hypothetical protein
MPEPMYLLDFRRMVVEKIEDPKPPLDIGVLEAREDPRNVGITFATLGSVPANDDQE